MYLSEGSIFDVGSGRGVTIDDHQLALRNSQPGRVSFLSYVTVLTPHQSHQNILQILDV